MEKKLNFKEKVLRFTKISKKWTHKYIWILTIVCICLMLMLTWMSRNSNVIAHNKDKNTITATMVGDIMLGRNVEHVINRKGYDYLFRHVNSYFANSDYVVGNFEHPTINNEDEYLKQEKRISLYANTDSITALQKQNFSVLNLANNHLMDYSSQGLTDTLNAFKEIDMPIVGAGVNEEDASTIDYQNVNGKIFATLGFSDAYALESNNAANNKPGILPAKPEIFIPLIHEAKKNADFVIVNMHWGQEYESSASPRQKALAKAVSHAGADIIIGSHPHVVQSIDRYNDTIIFYSLGNFIFDQGWSATKESVIVQLKLDENGKADFEITPLLIKEATPTPLKETSVYRRKKIFQRLMQEAPDTIQFEEKEGKLTFTVNYDAQ